MLVLRILLVVLAAETVANQSAEEFTEIKKTLDILARQIITSQIVTEENIRSEGQSGIHNVRLLSQGSRHYHSSSHNGPVGAAASHDHANNARTVGLGEFIAVLNGVKFRTRHNDYRLAAPSLKSKELDLIEDIEYPKVPGRVLNQPTIDDQIVEMREWFKAWKDQDYSIRDYRKFFKPVLCYLEGAWINDTEFQESFESDRHHLNAESFEDLQKYIAFSAATGRKDPDENLAFLPSQISDLDELGKPNLVQWNYRILCHPLKKDLPLNRFHLVDDLAVRLHKRKSMEKLAASRFARFTLNPTDQDEWVSDEFEYQLIDDIMSEIPGKDNYPASITDLNTAFPYNKPEDGSNDDELNVGYYHRWVRAEKGALGRTKHHLGFNDENLWVAHNSQEKVAAYRKTTCKKKICIDYESKVSWAIPLEVIYLTPLLSWNPYQLVYRGEDKSEEGKRVKADGRTGGNTTSTAYDGLNSKIFYMTPDQFYTGKEVEVDASDTTASSLGILSADGTEVHQVRASGHRVFLPPIEGIGTLRTRWPIFPVHGEGHNLWKEVEAIKDIILEADKHPYVAHSTAGIALPGEEDSNLLDSYTLLSGISKAEGGLHQHEVELTGSQMKQLAESWVEVVSEQASGHTHIFKLKCRLAVNNVCEEIYYGKCDGSYNCADGHMKDFEMLSSGS